MPSDMETLTNLEGIVLDLEKQVMTARSAVESAARQIEICCPHCKGSSPLGSWQFEYHVTHEHWNFTDLNPSMSLDYSFIRCSKCQKVIYIENWNARVENESGREAYALGTLRVVVITYRKLMKMTQCGY